MKRILVAALILVAAIQIVEPAFAARRVVRRGPHRRTTVVVHRGWPLKRPVRTVVVRPARAAFRVAPAVFLTTVTFTAAFVATAPARDALIWEDGETLDKSEDWTEFTLNCDARGEKLFLQVVNGKVQADWAEVVFENGDTQVVDFEEKSHGRGLYSLLDFKDGRKVDHVRMVARAQTDRARIVLKIQK